MSNFKGKRMVSEDLIKKLEDLDPSGGAEYTAGTGIDITENVISVDNTIPTLNGNNIFTGQNVFEQGIEYGTASVISPEETYLEVHTEDESFNSRTSMGISEGSGSMFVEESWEDSETHEQVNMSSSIDISAGNISLSSNNLSTQDSTEVVITPEGMTLNSQPVVTEDMLSTVATTGDYDDLTNKPTIPDAVSGTNDGINWTGLTIGNDTYAIPAGGSGSSYTFTNGLTESSGTVSWNLNDIIKRGIATDSLKILGGNTASNSHSIAIGPNSSAEGVDCIAINGARARVSKNIAIGEGINTFQMTDNGVAIGKYNNTNNLSNKLFVIGNGTNDSNRSNAMTVSKDGTIVSKNLPAVDTTTDGTYVLKATVSSGVVTYAWVLEV